MPAVVVNPDTDSAPPIVVLPDTLAVPAIVVLPVESVPLFVIEPVFVMPLVLVWPVTPNVPPTVALPVLTMLEEFSVFALLTFWFPILSAPVIGN